MLPQNSLMPHCPVTVRVVNNKGETAMKKLMTLVFAAMIAVTLSVPAWSQAPTAAAQSKSAKNDKKEAAKEKKDKKKAEKQASKQTKKK